MEEWLRVGKKGLLQVCVSSEHGLEKVKKMEKIGENRRKLEKMTYYKSVFHLSYLRSHCFRHKRDSQTHTDHYYTGTVHLYRLSKDINIEINLVSFL